MGTDPTGITALPAPQRDGGLLSLELPWNADATTDFGHLVYSLDLSQWFDAANPIHLGIGVLVKTTTTHSVSINPDLQPRWFYRIE